MPNEILTYTGKLVDPFNMRAEDIDIEDIAHALAHTCRFNGHTRRFYSVAEHSLYVYAACEMESIQTKLYALLHDAGEAYLPDIPSPIKHRFPAMVHAENTILWEVTNSFMGALDIGELLTVRSKVDDADKMVLAIELDSVMTGGDPKNLRESFPEYEANTAPNQVENEFLQLYLSLWEQLPHD